MQLGNKIQHTSVQLGIKKFTGMHFFGNKINSQTSRVVLPLPQTKMMMSNSPVEKYHINNH